jgi:hypothetical protein
MLKHPCNSDYNQYITDCTSPPSHKPQYKSTQAEYIWLFHILPSGMRLIHLACRPTHSCGVMYSHVKQHSSTSSSAASAQHNKAVNPTKAALSEHHFICGFQENINE